MKVDLTNITSLEDVEAKIEEFATKGDNQEYRYLLDKEIAEENKAKLSAEISALEEEIAGIDTDIPAEGLKTDAEIAARQEKITLKEEKLAALKQLKDKVKAEERIISGHDDKIIKKGITKELGQNILKVEEIERKIADLDKANPDEELPDATNAKKEAYREAIEKAKKELQEELKPLKEKAEQEKVEIRSNAHKAYDYAINDRRDLRDERSAFFTQAKTKLENDKIAVEREMKLIELKADKYTAMTPEQLKEAKAEMSAKLENVTKAITSCQEQLGIIKVERDEEAKKYGLRSFQRRPDETKIEKPEGAKTESEKIEGEKSEGEKPEGEKPGKPLAKIDGKRTYESLGFWNRYKMKRDAYAVAEGLKSNEQLSFGRKLLLMLPSYKYSEMASRMISSKDITAPEGTVLFEQPEVKTEESKEEPKNNNPWEVPQDVKDRTDEVGKQAAEQSQQSKEQEQGKGQKQEKSNDKEHSI